MADLATSRFDVYDESLGIGAEGYVAPPMFERFYDIKDEQSRWTYLLHELVDLAKSNALYLTDILNQDKFVSDSVGDVLFNRLMSGTREHRQVHMVEPLPPELTKPCVRVRAINGATEVKWTGNPIQGPVIVGRGDTVPEGHRRIKYGTVNTHEADVVLTPQEAWVCLKESGKFVFRAKRADHQKKAWKCEEVRPDGQREDKPTVTKSAVGKKSFAEVNRSAA